MSAGAKRIRNYVAIGLAAAAEIDASVFAARHRTLKNSDLPAILVFTDAERISGSTALAPGVRKYERTLELSIAVIVSTGAANDRGEGVADALDDLAEAVEAWMFDREDFPASDPDPVWIEVVLSRTQTGVADESATPTPMKVLTFDVLWHDTAPKQRPSTLDPLTEIRVSQDLVEPDGQVDAIDEILVPQS